MAEEDAPLMWEDKLTEMRERVQDFGKNAKAKVEEMESVTREHPKTALTTAFLVGAAMGAMNFFRGLTAAFIVAVMGALVLAAIGLAPQRGGPTVVTAAANASGADLAHVFRGVFALGVLCLVISLIALIRMEQRPLRGRSEPPEA